jgi:hypothetical protein
MANYSGRLDAFAAQYPRLQTVSEFGVVRWSPGAVQFLRDQMDDIDRRGMNYAIWGWDSIWEPWRTWGSKAMNCWFGPEPSNYTEAPNAMVNEIVTAWGRNTGRPLHFRPSGRAMAGGRGALEARTGICLTKR